MLIKAQALGLTPLCYVSIAVKCTPYPVSLFTNVLLVIRGTMESSINRKAIQSMLHVSPSIESALSWTYEEQHSP
jgi:hypothetical protein